LAADFTELLKIRTEEGLTNQKELSQAHTDMENLLAKRGELEAERRK